MVAEPVGVWGGGLCGRDPHTEDSILAKRRLVLKPGDGLFIRGGLEMDGRLKIVQFWKKESRTKIYRKRQKLQHSECEVVMWERG